mgnify:CR=1 FL=1
MQDDNEKPFILCGTTGKKFEIFNELLIGRSETSDIVMRDNNRVSREHGLISQDGDIVHYTDLESVNGSWIDGIKLAPDRPQVLSHGSVIRLANRHFVFCIKDDPDLTEQTIATLGAEPLDDTFLGPASLENMSATARAKNLTEKIETKIHKVVLGKLKESYGDDWWYEAIPQRIRINAACIQEKGSRTADKEDCLMLLDLMNIMLSNWSQFGDRFDPDGKGKRVFESRYNSLNNIRNRLSHPIRLKNEPIKKSELEELESWILI